ncbi:MAG: hypothetical protein GX442_09070 [Candidatus Riflebacteria bacterium]|nr:hypothetical protein [Candidatus Riflebacteria bacterium]
MTRFSVLALLVVSLLALTGCGNGDDPVAPTVPTTVTTGNVAVTQNVVLPAGSVSTASLREATFWREFALRIGATDYAPTSYTTNTDGSVTLVFSLLLAKSTLGSTWTESTKIISNVQLIEGGQPILTLAGLVGNDQAATLSTTPTPNSVTIALSTNTDGGITYTVTAGSSYVTGVTSPITAASDLLYVEKITYQKGADWLTLTASSTDVPYSGTTFKVYFNTAVANATTSWDIYVLNTATNMYFNLNSTNNSALFTVTAATESGKTVLTVVVVGDATHKLRASQPYKVTLKAGNSLTRADKSTVKLTTDITRTFTTGS